MKTIIIIFLVWCLVSVILAFCYAGYKSEDHAIQIEALKRELIRLKKENEQLSLRVVEAEMGGWKHKAVTP